MPPVKEVCCLSEMERGNPSSSPSPSPRPRPGGPVSRDEKAISRSWIGGSRERVEA
jgi:hypothetical protein